MQKLSERLKEILTGYNSCFHGYEPVKECSDCKDIIKQETEVILDAIRERIPKERIIIAMDEFFPDMKEY